MQLGSERGEWRAREKKWGCVGSSLTSLPSLFVKYVYFVKFGSLVQGARPRGDGMIN